MRIHHTPGFSFLLSFHRLSWRRNRPRKATKTQLKTWSPWVSLATIGFSLFLLASLYLPILALDPFGLPALIALDFPCFFSFFLFTFFLITIESLNFPITNIHPFHRTSPTPIVHKATPFTRTLHQYQSFVLLCPPPPQNNPFGLTLLFPRVVFAHTSSLYKYRSSSHLPSSHVHRRQNFHELSIPTVPLLTLQFGSPRRTPP